jgi:hypothetical protein
MRGIERVSGFLAGLLGIAALVFALTQHVERSFTGTVLYGPGVSGGDMLSIVLALTLAVVTALAVALSAMQDTRSLGRGVWRWPLILGAALCVGGIYLLILSDIWVEVGTAPATDLISAGLLFAPSALAAIICALASLRPRTLAARA